MHLSPSPLLLARRSLLTTAPLAARRSLATAAPPSTPPPNPSSSTPSSSSLTSSLPPSVREAFKTNPVLKKLIGDEIARRNLKAIGEAMFKSGIGADGKQPSAMEMAKLMMNSELKTAIQGLTASMQRLGVQMSDLAPLMKDLMGNKGSFDSFAPSPPSSSSATADPVFDALRAKAGGVKETAVEVKDAVEEAASAVKDEAAQGRGGVLSQMFGGGKK